MATVQQQVNVKVKNDNLLKKKVNDEQVVDDMHWVSTQLEAPSPDPVSATLDTGVMVVADASEGSNSSVSASNSMEAASTASSTSALSNTAMIGVGVGAGLLVVAGASGGSGGGGSDSTPTTAPTEAPKKSTLSIQDGPINGADVYVDSDGDGKITSADVKVGKTDASGNLQVNQSVLAGKSILATGGTDNATGLSFSGVLKAPDGATMINPLTTLTQQLIESNPNLTVAQAQTKVKTALGIPSSVDLTTFNPATDSNVTTALAVQKAAVQVANIMAVLTVATGGDALSASEGISQAIANVIAKSSGTLDLASSIAIIKITANAGVSITASVTDAIATANDTIANAKTLTGVVKMQETVQSVNAGSLTQLADSVDSTASKIPTTAPTEAPTTTPSGGGGSYTPPPDTTPPTLSITSNVHAVKVGETATITFSFSEQPYGFSAGDIVTTGGTLSNLTVDAINNRVYTATFTPTTNTQENASITVALGAYTDASGNAGTAGATPNVSIDTLVPTIQTIANNLSYGASEFSAQTSTDGTKIVITSSEAMALGTATASSFSINGSSVTVTGVAVDSTDHTKVNLTLSTPLARDITPITLTYSGGLTDVAGNALEGFSAQAVHNTVANVSPIAATITASKFVQLDTSADKNYIELTGTDFFKFIDKANGAGTDSDIKDQFDWTKFVWQVKGATDSDITFTAGDISKVNISSDTTMKVYITDVKWNDITQVSDLLASGSTSTADNLTITAGFLRDADQVISNASNSAPFGDSQYTAVLASDSVFSNIYASTVMLSGAGTFDGTKLKASDVAVTASGDGDIILERMTTLGTLESTKTSGSLTVQTWDVADEQTIVANANIINTGGDQIQVWFDTSNLGDTTITSLTLIGKNYDLWFDQSSDVGLHLVHEGDSEANIFHYLGDFSSDGLLDIGGFESGSDIIHLDSSILSSLTGTGTAVDLANTNFVSRASDHTAQDDSDFIVYQADTGGVYYDADANGSGSAVLLFTLTDMPTLANTDFKVI